MSVVEMLIENILLFEMKACGTCYETAFKALMDSNSFGSAGKFGGWNLVHGIVTLTGGSYKGVQTGHAWIEKGNKVYDTEKRIGMSKKAYYTLGSIGYTHRYSWKQAAKEASKSGHYGPWDKKIWNAGE